MRYVLIVILALQTLDAGAQAIFSTDHNPDSLHARLRSSRSDIETITAWNGLANHHKFSRADSGLYYASKAIKLSHEIGYEFGELIGMAMLSLSYRTQGNYSKSFRIELEGMQRAEKAENKIPLAMFQLIHGSKFIETREYEKAFRLIKSSAQLFDAFGEYPMRTISELDIARIYTETGVKDSSFFYIREAANYAKKAEIKWLTSAVYSRMSQAHKVFGELDSAMYYIKVAERAAESSSWKSRANFAIAQFMLEAGHRDSTLVYAEKALRYAMEDRLFKHSKDISTYISEQYAESDERLALQYSLTAVRYSDSLLSLNTMSTYSDFLDFDESQRQYELELLKQEYETENKLILMWGGIALLLIAMFFLFRNARLKQAAKLKVEEAFEQLKSTQTQLIQSEKMASLGELTAGIAHEIQNPLNFVNNFSEVNTELIAEMKAEFDNGNFEEAKAILDNLIENEQKIVLHGKRADGIVKSMLHHSRISTGKKEPTDLNVLADEYLRLAYHGLRAKDKSFNAQFSTDLDPALPKIEAVPQDIGRVLLNLINNAFYACSERAKGGTAERQNGETQSTVGSPQSAVANSEQQMATGQQPKASSQKPAAYLPMVTITTRNLGDKIEIRVKDNGIGIPEPIVDKIFQPFFTTKPTGQGTGLGLSLSYDIVNAHGGEIKVSTKENEGTEFIIQLPVG